MQSKYFQNTMTFQMGCPNPWFVFLLASIICVDLENRPDGPKNHPTYKTKRYVIIYALCSGNFKNVKLGSTVLKFKNFMWNQYWQTFFTIYLDSDLWILVNLGLVKLLRFTKYQNSEPLKLPKMASYKLLHPLKLI